MKTTVNHTGESKGKREVHMSLYRASLALRKHMLRYRHTPDPGQKTTEEELTRMFLRELAANRRMLSYSFSRKEEAKNGADWIWIFLTELPRCASKAIPVLFRHKACCPAPKKSGRPPSM